jgi:hypothetical protein
MTMDRPLLTAAERPAFTSARETFGWLGVLFGAVSIVMLAVHGFQVGLVPAFEPLVEFYERAAQATLGWAEPLINAALASAREWIGYDLAIHPHWKHVLVLLMLYFSRNVAITRTTRGPASAIVRAIWAIVVAVLTSVGVGVVALAHDFQSSALIALIPVAGVTLFDLGNDIWGATFFRSSGSGWWQYFFFESRLVLLRAVAAIVIVVAGLNWAPLMNTENPGLLLLGVLVVLFSFYWIWLGTLWPARNRSRDEWRNTVGREGAMRLGRSMLGSFAGAIAFLAVNAGLQ